MPKNFEFHIKKSENDFKLYNFKQEVSGIGCKLRKNSLSLL